MEPTSSPDNNRTSRGLSRFWPVHREAEDEAATPDSTESSVARTGEIELGETQMVALGSRRATDPGTPIHGGVFPAGPFSGGPGTPHSPYASAARGPAGGSPSPD